MKKVALSFLMFIAALSLSAEQTLAEQTKLTGAAAIAKFPARLQDSEIAHLSDASWCQLMPGVEYFFGRFTKLYENVAASGKIAEDISLIRIDYKNARVRMKFVDNRLISGSNKTTSKIAKQYNALFGVNCTFPAWYAQMEGKVYSATGNKEGGLAFNDDKSYKFFRRFSEIDPTQWENVFSTEGYGLENGSPTLTEQTANAARTFMATDKDGVLYVAVADVKSPKKGLSYYSTMRYLVEFGATDGMTIDGGGSTTMVISKTLIPAGVQDLQHDSQDSDEHYTMNWTSDSSAGRERSVCNQLLFIEDVATVTMDFSSHGSCSLGTGTVKFGKNSTQNYTVTADSGYQIAYLAYQGQPIDAAKGKTSYSGSFLADGDKTITATFVKKTAWWLKPKVVNDFAVAKYIKKNIYDGAAVTVDENNQNVYFGLSTHSYSSASNGVVGYAVADLVGGKSTPTCGTRAMYNDAGVTLNTEYVKDIAVSATAKALLVGRKTGATDQHAIVCPLGKSWGDPEYANYNSVAKDARFLLQNDINFNDGEKTSVTQDSIFQCAFTPDGKRLYAAAGYAGNGSRYVLEYNVQTDASGAMTGIQPTGKIIKFSTTVFSMTCGTVNGKYILIGTDTNGMLGMIAPDDFKADGNGFVSSTAQARYEKLGKFTGMCVTGAEDGTPRLIGSVANGQFSVYDIKPDGSGLVSTTPIVTYDHYATFDNAGMDAFACTSDDQTAFFSYTVIGDGSRKSLYAKVVQADVEGPGEDEPELIPVAKPTAATGLVYTGKSQTGVAAGTGYAVANGSGTNAGSYTATVTLEDGYCWADESTDALTLPWSIARAAVTVKAKDRTIGLGMTPAAFGYDVTGGSLVSGETLSGALACAADGKSAGTWKITQGTLTDANNPNYAITFVEGTLTVVQLTAVLNPASAVYDGTVKDPAVTVLDDSGATLPAGSFTVTKPTGEVKDAGTYAYGVSVTAGELTGLELSADFVIRPKTVAVTVTAGQKKTYGAADPAEFACAKDALVGTDAYSGALARAEGENVGIYAISQGTLTAGKNYEIAFKGADFEITKKELTVTPTAVVLSYGDEKPTTFAFDIAGFALSDTQAVVTGEPTFTCDYAKGSDVGTYDIAVNVGGLSADNYTFAGVKGTLTVSQKTPTLSEVSATAITYGQTLADSVVSATVDPDIAGTFAWADVSIAPTVADGGVTVYEGTFTPSDAKNYRAAAFSTTVVVNRKEIAVPTANTGLVFNFSEQTGVASGEGYTLSGEKATAAGDYVATAALSDKQNTCWADDKTTDDKEIAWSIAESTPEVSGTAKAGVDWNGSEVTLDIENLNLGSHALEDLAATLEVNGKSYDGVVTAQGIGAYRVSFAVDATGENAVVATNGYEGAYRVTLADGTDDPVVVASGTQDVLQGMPATATNGWFHETAETVGQTGAWTKGGEAAELTTEDGRLVIEPTGTSTLDFAPTTAMDAGAKGVVEASILFEGPCDEDDAAPSAGGQCAVRIAEDDETSAVKLQVYAALPDGDGGWNVGWHDWNQPEAETYSFVVGTEYAIRLVCDYETGSNALKCFVKQAGADGYVLLFSGYLTGVSEGAGAPKRIATLGFEGTGKVSVLDGTFTRDFLDASVATVGGVKYATVADAVAAGGQVTLLWDASWTPTENGDYSFVSNGHELKIGGDLVFKVTKNADGTLSVTVGGTVEEPKPTTIALKDGKVVIGVANPDPKRRYALARVERLGDEFVTDESTRKTGAELLDGALLEVPVKSGATSEFFKVVVE